jgi:hypothetical protein
MKAFLEKFKTVNDSFEVTLCENGYIVNISGRTDADDWINKKIVCTTLEELFDLITDIDLMDTQ